MTDELLLRFTPSIESMLLIPSGKGRFEVMVGDRLLFSKKSLGRHANPGEVATLFEELTGVASLPAER